MLLIRQKAGKTRWPIMRDSSVLYSLVMICIFAHLEISLYLIHALVCLSPVPHVFAWMFTHWLFHLSVCVYSGPKGPQKITNWGPAAFTDTELSLREKGWKERKSRPDQTQWRIIAVLPALLQSVPVHLTTTEWGNIGQVGHIPLKRTFETCVTA